MSVQYNRVQSNRFALFAAALSGFVLAALLIGSAPATATAPAASRTDGTAGSAITAMWAWGNPIDKAVDERGMGQPAFQPSALSAFASAHQLKTVYLSVPWAADQGPFSAWLRSAVKALHGAGVTTVAALGGDTSWASQPEFAAAWTRSALTAAPFDAVQFDVEPWVNATDSQLPGIAGNLNNMYDAAAQAAGKVPIGADLPWWLAAKPAPSGGTLFGDLLSHLRSVAIVAFVDHAEGEDGIVTLARPATAVASAAHIPFTIGVETDTPEVTGGAAATFGDDSAAALEGQSTIVRSRFSGLSGYSGVAVEHLLSWKDLLNR